MRPSRRLLVLLVSAAVAAAPAPAWAQGNTPSGDPAAGTDTGQTATDAPTDAPPLTSTPQDGDEGVDPSPIAPPPSEKDDTEGNASGSGSPAGAGRTRPVDELPRTGLDTRAVVLLGLALTLAGIGLRLRTADERF